MTSTASPRDSGLGCFLALNRIATTRKKEKKKVTTNPFPSRLAEMGWASPTKLWPAWKSKVSSFSSDLGPSTLHLCCKCGNLHLLGSWVEPKIPLTAQGSLPGWFALQCPV